MSADAQEMIGIGVLVLFCSLACCMCNYVDHRGEWMKTCLKAHGPKECRP